MKRHLPFYRRIALRDSRLIRQLNQQEVFYCLKKNTKLSISDIAQAADLSVSSAKSIVQELMDLSFVAEIGEGSSTGGRRPKLYNLDLKGNLVVGVDVGGEKIRTRLCRLDSEILGNRVHSGVRSETELVAAVAEDLKALLESCDLQEERLIGIGVSIPENAAQAIRQLPVFSQQEDPLQGVRRYDELTAPVFFMEETNARLIAEMEYGFLQEKENAAFVEIGLEETGQGIRGSLLCSNLVYQGQNGCAGEIGHIVLDPEGPACSCGQKGCWLAVGDLLALRQRLKAGHGIETRDTGELACMLLDGVDRGDESLKREFLDFVEIQARGVAVLMQILDPELVVIGGEVTRFGERFVTELRKSVRLKIPELRAPQPAIEVSLFRDDGPILGAVAYVLQHAIELRRNI